MRGKISQWNDAKGFGFIRTRDHRIFCHATDLCPCLRPLRGGSVPQGTVVEFDLVDTPKGYQAKSAKCEVCAAPETWELKQYGDSVRGLDGVFQYLRPYSSKRGFCSGYPWTEAEIDEINRAYNKAQGEFSRFHQGYKSLSEEFLAEFGPILSVEKTGPQMYSVEFGYGTRQLYSCGLWQSAGFSWSRSGDFIISDKSVSTRYFEENWGLELEVDICSWYDGVVSFCYRDIDPELRALTIEKAQPLISSDWDTVLLLCNFADTKKSFQDALSKLRNPGPRPYLKMASGKHQAYYESPDERRAGYETVYWTQRFIHLGENCEFSVPTDSKLVDVQEVIADEIRILCDRAVGIIHRDFESKLKSMMKKDVIIPNQYSSKEEYCEALRALFESIDWEF